eukprot:7391539-Prymnesium_polylepis.1
MWRLHVLAHVRARVRHTAVVVGVHEGAGERVAVRGEVGGHTVAHPREQVRDRDLPANASGSGTRSVGWQEHTISDSNQRSAEIWSAVIDPRRNFTRMAQIRKMKPALQVRRRMTNDSPL